MSVLSVQWMQPVIMVVEIGTVTFVQKYCTHRQAGLRIAAKAVIQIWRQPAGKDIHSGGNVTVTTAYGSNGTVGRHYLIRVDGERDLRLTSTLKTLY